MKQYRCEVTEIRTYRQTYWVEAENEREAREKAEIGDTLREQGFNHDYSVVERVIGDVEIEDADS